METTSSLQKQCPGCFWDIWSLLLGILGPIEANGCKPGATQKQPPGAPRKTLHWSIEPGVMGVNHTSGYLSHQVMTHQWPTTHSLGNDSLSNMFSLAIYGPIISLASAWASGAVAALSCGSAGDQASQVASGDNYLTP